MRRYNNDTWRSPEFYIDGYYWFSAAGGQERSKYGPEWAAFISIYIQTRIINSLKLTALSAGGARAGALSAGQNFWLWSPLEAPK